VIIEKLTFDVVIWVYNWRIKVAYDAGYAAKAAEIDAAMVQVGQTIARLNGELAAKDAETVRKIEEDREKRPFRTQYVRERLVNAPEFAAIERPRDLASCRLWQLCQIDSAATGGVQREWCNAVRGSCDGVVQPSR
jgi:hypothetical protein